MLESIRKGNLCFVVVCMAKTTNQQGYKMSIQHQNNQNCIKYETIVEEIREQLTEVM